MRDRTRFNIRLGNLELRSGFIMNTENLRKPVVAEIIHHFSDSEECNYGGAGYSLIAYFSDEGHRVPGFHHWMAGPMDSRINQEDFGTLMQMGYKLLDSGRQHFVVKGEEIP
jgi:hypothetical protein